MREEKRQSGFSFAEAFVMASIFGLMLLVALPNYLQRRTQNQANDLAEAFRTYGATIQAYRNENGNWPEKAPLVGGHSTMEDPLARPDNGFSRRWTTYLMTATSPRVTYS